MSRTYSRLLVILLLLYGLSFAVRFFFPVEDKPFRYESKETIEWEGASITISYFEFGESGENPPIILIPDPFTPVQKFERFSSQVSADQKIIVPLFPSKNDSGNLIGHSPEARADLLLKFLENGGYAEFDLIGHGFGNSVAIRLLEKVPKTSVRSYAMLSAIGVQEFHFLGYHVLNKPIYSILYPIGWFLEYGLPVANWNSYIPINLSGARFLNTMDQRPYRDILSGVDIPVHIIHSSKDRQISVNTAREHYRIIPQSTIEVTDGDHSAIHSKAEEWADSYTSFLNDAKSSNQPISNTITQERIKNAQKEFSLQDVPPVDNWAFFMVVFLLTIVTLVSEDLGCIGAGLLAAGNVITIWVAFIIVFIGILIVDICIYWIGRTFGRPVIQKPPLKWLISKKDIDWTATLFKNNGFKIMWGSRFLPGTRFPTYFSAGVLHTPFPTFFLYFLTSVLIWTPLVLGVSILVGQQMISYLQIYQEYAVHIFFLLVIAIYLGFKFLLPLSTRKGRKEMAVYFIRLKQRLFNKPHR